MHLPVVAELCGIISIWWLHCHWFRDKWGISIMLLIYLLVLLLVLQYYWR